MGTINERIQFVINEDFNGSVSSFEKACGIKKDTLKHVVGGRMSSPSLDTFDSIRRTVVRYNLLWLLAGEGKMLKEEISSLPAISDSSQVEELKAEINQLKGENRILREQVGLGERKEVKSA